MKLFRSVFSLICVLFIVMALLGAVTFAQTYPTANPTYVPNAIGPQTSFTAAGDYYFNCNGVAAATLSLEGTYTGLSATLRITTSGYPLSSSSTWIQVGMYPVGTSSGALVTSLVTVATTGIYNFECDGRTGANLHITAIATGTVKVKMIASPQTKFVHTNMFVDPCADPMVAKSTAVVNIGAATTTKIVDTSASTVVYICSIYASLAGTTPSITFKTGTHVTNDCDTGPSTLSGVILPTSGSFLTFPGGGTLFKTAAGGQFCGTTVGTGSSLQGIATYVQQ